MPQPLTAVQKEILQILLKLELLKKEDGGSWISTTALAHKYYKTDFVGQVSRDTITHSLKSLRKRGLVVGQMQTYQAQNRNRVGRHRDRARRKFWVWKLNPDRDKRRKIGA